jgi:putative ABC transport system permease protein
MTFYDISMKMLITNFSKYKLYFFCNVFSVTLFYSFAAIFTNESFMNGRIVDYSISSNIYVPSILVGVLLAMFIPYSYHIFLRNRKYEYGIFMTLGMSETQVFTNMLIEIFVIAGMALITGLILGTAVSFFFYLFIKLVIGISDLHLFLSMDSYILTAILYGATTLFSFCTGVFGFIKMPLIVIIKEKFAAEKRDKPNLVLFLFGITIVIISIVIMVMGFGYGPSKMWFVSFIMMLIGLYMIFTHWERMEQCFHKIIPAYKNQHIIELSFIKHHYKSRSKINLVSSWLIGFAIFFSGFCMVMYPSFTDNAISYSPYDLVYSQIFGKNQVTNNEIENLLNQNQVFVKTLKQVNYSRSRAFTLLPVSEVNGKLGGDYHVPEGSFQMLYQYNPKDNYEHELTSSDVFSFNCGDETLQLQRIGSDIKILFNKNPTFADMTLILNDADYNKIITKCDGFWSGIMKLYTFDDWRSSAKGIDAVQKFLFVKNQVDKSDQHYYKATSRIETYTTAKQSAEFLIFLTFFIVLLFFLASNIMIHFKIKGEAEEEQRMLSSLYRIGITTEEILRMIKHKNAYYYMPQVIIGLLMGVFYGYAVNRYYGYGWRAAIYSLFVGVVLVILQLIGLIRYSRRELLNFNI